jgi:hypothetical protein
LNRPADFVVAPNHGVELAVACALGQIDTVFFQGFALTFRFCTFDFLAAAHGLDRRFHGLSRQALFFGHLAPVALVIAQREQEQFAGNELVTPLESLLLSGLDQGHQVATDLDLLLPLHLRQALHGRLGRAQQAAHIHPSALQQGFGAVLLT